MNRPLLERARWLHQAGKAREAARAYEAVLRAEPQLFEALYGLAILAFQEGRLGDAERRIAQALASRPEASAFFFQATIFHRQNRIADALSALNRAIVARPDYKEARLNRGAALMALGRHAEALVDLEAVLAIDPQNAGALSNKGAILLTLRRPEAALLCFDKALSIHPQFLEALVNRGKALSELQRFDEAAAAYEKVVRLNPDLAYARGHLAHYRLCACDWRHLEEDAAVIAAGLKAGKPVVQPLIATLLYDTPREPALSANIAARDWPTSPQPLWNGERYGHGRIRVAYLSSDFHEHATAYLMAGVFEAHDRMRFETIAVSSGPDDASPMRARLARAFDQFWDVRRDSDAEIARRLRASEIDIAIDLKGYTNGARPGILAHRPAPVQAHYLGYPGTMGAPFVDYIIADRFVIPAEDRAFYAEKIVTLPDSYQCNDRKRPISATAPSRRDAGLPESGFVFCCFNSPAKIRPGFFASWMRLLAAVKGSVLWLFENTPDATRHLRYEAEIRGIDPRRLIFARRVPLAEHLARHRLADLFLDTLPYGAHTSASDALWAGVPVLTVKGASFAGRVGASLLHAIGLPELIAPSLGDYEAMALQLATDTSRLAGLQAKLQSQRDHCPLFDTARFARHFEAALVLMHERRMRGEAPADIMVPATGSRGQSEAGITF